MKQQFSNVAPANAQVLKSRATAEALVQCAFSASTRPNVQPEMVGRFCAQPSPSNCSRSILLSEKMV